MASENIYVQDNDVVLHMSSHWMLYLHDVFEILAPDGVPWKLLFQRRSQQLLRRWSASQQREDADMQKLRWIRGGLAKNCTPTRFDLYCCLWYFMGIFFFIVSNVIHPFIHYLRPWLEIWNRSWYISGPTDHSIIICLLNQIWSNSHDVNLVSVHLFWR